MGKFSSGAAKPGNGKQMGGGGRFPSMGYTVLSSSSPKSSSKQPGALKLPGTLKGGPGGGRS